METKREQTWKKKRIKSNASLISNYIVIAGDYTEKNEKKLRNEHS